jgi:hypothetical protein
MVPLGLVIFVTIYENRKEYSRPLMSIFCSVQGQVHVFIGFRTTDGSNQNVRKTTSSGSERYFVDALDCEKSYDFI